VGIVVSTAARYPKKVKQGDIREWCKRKHQKNRNNYNIDAG
jgi:hypothetical protein